MGKWLEAAAGISTADWRRNLMKVLNDPIVSKWAKEHPEADETVLQQNVNRLYQYAKEAKACKLCPGLEGCPNDLAGHFTKIVLEAGANGGVSITDYKSPCSLYVTKSNENAVRARIQSFYVDEQALHQQYAVEEIVSKDLERAQAVESVLEYILLTRSEGLQRKGLFLVGDFGTGKTFLASYLLYELAKSGYTGVIVYMPDFVEEIKGMFGEPQKIKETIELLKETDLVVFDDVGAEQLNAWMRDQVLGTILNYRMNRKPTFFTSNHDLNDLERHFSYTAREGEDVYRAQRIMDRIRPFVNVVEVTGRNHRGG